MYFYAAALRACIEPRGISATRRYRRARCERKCFRRLFRRFDIEIDGDARAGIVLVQSVNGVTTPRLLDHHLHILHARVGVGFACPPDVDSFALTCSALPSPTCTVIFPRDSYRPETCAPAKESFAARYLLQLCE